MATDTEPNTGRHTKTDPAGDAEAHGHSAGDEVLGVSREGEPKGPANPAFRGIPIATKRERLSAVQALATEHLSAEQIRDFLPAWGLNLSLSTVYAYLPLVKLPPGYRKRVERRSWREHDVRAVGHMTRLALDGRALGLRMDRILVARKLKGLPIIPDVQFFFGRHGYFVEEQAASLPSARWIDRLETHFDRRLKTRDSIRELFIVEGRSETERARGHARQVQAARGREDVKLFLFADRASFEGAGNVVSDRIWMTPYGEAISLVDWSGRPGESPTV